MKLARKRPSRRTNNWQTRLTAVPTAARGSTVAFFVNHNVEKGRGTTSLLTRGPLALRLNEFIRLVYSRWLIPQKLNKE